MLQHNGKQYVGWRLAQTDPVRVRGVLLICMGPCTCTVSCLLTTEILHRDASLPGVLCPAVLAVTSGEGALHRLEHLKQVQGEWSHSERLLSVVICRCLARAEVFHGNHESSCDCPCDFRSSREIPGSVTIFLYHPRVAEANADIAGGVVPAPVRALTSACPADLFQLPGCTPGQQ